MRFASLALFVFLSLAACRHLQWDARSHVINESISIKENEEGHFSGVAGLGFSEEEIIAYIENVACLPGEQVVEYKADILTAVPNAWVFEGRCG